MKIRRPVGYRVFMVVFAASMAVFAGYLVSLQFTRHIAVSGRLSTGAYTLLALLFAAAVLRYGLRRFRVDVDRDGWAVWIGPYRRDVPWAEISAVVIEHRQYQVRGRRESAPALFLVPEPGVRLDAPGDRQARVDGRPAVRLFDLGDVKIEEKQFVRDLAGLAGDRLQIRVYPLGVLMLSEKAQKLLNGTPLPAFPPGVAGVRTQRWLNRRRFLLFAGWYLVAVVPALLLTGFAARVHELLGAVVAVSGVVAVVIAYAEFVTLFGHAIDLVETEAAIAGTQLMRVFGDRTDLDDLHAGKAVVLPPGTERGYGKAWLLGFPKVALLLGDPRTGRLRGHDDLLGLSAVLGESPHEADRVAAREIDNLAVQSQAGGPEEPGNAENARLWLSLTTAGRVLAWAVVVGSVLLAGGWILESSSFLGGAVILIGFALAAVWAIYALYRTLVLLATVWRAVRKSL